MPERAVRDSLAMDTVATDPTLLPAHKLVQAIAARRLSPVDVVAAFLDRIAAQGSKLHAFVAVYADEARLAGAAGRQAIPACPPGGPPHRRALAPPKPH